ncbi:protein Rad9 [Escherichia phage HZ2R8]|uniref:Protein Rad9 n=1 Tax=Escherichia phage HZ2R8 TaxID=2079317 RepID=A0A2K9VJZ7_9CAUD|nr:protein Rad9 [Escherichia phage HZ2R8]AUV62644.1 protein Rad9 [Escherichia phage HZ2R8]
MVRRLRLWTERCSFRPLLTAQTVLLLLLYVKDSAMPSRRCSKRWMMRPCSKHPQPLYGRCSDV